MELNNKEKKVKQVLSDINYDIDTDFLWKEVSQELDNTNKRRKLWFIPLFFIAVIGVAYLALNYQLTPINTVSELQTDTITANQAQNINTPSNGSYEEAEKETTETIDKEINRKAQIRNTKEANTQSISDNGITFQKNNEKVSTKTELKKSSNTTATKKSQSLQTINEKNSSEQTTNNVSERTSNVTEFNQQNLTTNRNIKTAPPKSLINDAKLVQPLSLFGIDKIQASAFATERNPWLISEENLASIEIKKPRSNRWFLSIGAGAIQNISTVNTAPSEFPTDYFNKEMALPGINASLQLGIQTRSNWRIFGGVDYAQLVTRFTNNELETVDGTLAIENQQSIDPSSALQSGAGSLATQAVIENDLQWHRHHKSWNVELGISRNLFAQSKFIVAPAFSLVQNLVSAHSGYYFTEQAPYFNKFTNNEKNPFRKNTGLKTQLALDLGYKLKGFEVSIHTAWRNPLQSITEQTNFYQTKNSQLSIQARVNYLLNWEN